MTKIHVLMLVLLVRRQLKHKGLISNTIQGPRGHGKKPPSSRLGTLYSAYRQWVMTKINVLRLFLSIQALRSNSNNTLGPSGHGRKPPSSRLGTLYSAYRQWVITKIHVLGLVLFIRRQFKRAGSISNTTLGPSGHGRKPPSSRLGTLYSCNRQLYMTKIHVFSLVLFVRHQFKRWGSISNTTLGPGGHGRRPPSSRLGTLYNYHRQCFMTKIHVLSLVLFVRRQFKHWGSISNSTLGPSDHGMKSPSSRLGTLYSYYRQWFMTKIHVLSLVLFVRRQLKRWESISNSTLGPRGHAKKPPSSKLGTLYSFYRQLYMAKIHVFRLVLFVRRQFKRSGLISNTKLGPSGHGRTPPSSRLGTLYTTYSQWVVTKTNVLTLVLFVRRQFNRWVLISNTTLGPSGHGMKPPSSRLGTLYSAYRQWVMTKSMY